MATTRPTRVLFVNTKTQPPLGADTWIHAQIMRQLDRSANQLTAACAIGTLHAPTPTYYALKDIPDLRVHPVDFGSELWGRSLAGKVTAIIRSLCAIRSLVGLVLLVRQNGVQIIHTSDRPRDALACVVLARLTRAKCLIHAHVAHGEWMSPVLRWSLKRADGLIAISGFVARSLVENGYDPRRIHEVLNGIDTESWQPGDGRKEIRQELRIPADAPVLITVCRLFPAKGTEDLIRCLPALLAAHPTLTLVVVGEEMIPGYKQHLRQIAQDLGVGKCVRFVGQRSDVPRLMAAADLFAMPSRYEPFGLVYLEAMAMRLPVVAMRNGGTPEVVIDGLTGLLCDPDDRRHLTMNILSLLADPARRQQMGEAGRRRVDARFTTMRMAADVDAVYKHLTAMPLATPDSRLETT